MKREIDWRHSNLYAAIRYFITRRCGASMDIAEYVTHGYGRLYTYGDWQFPLYFKEAPR